MAIREYLLSRFIPRKKRKRKKKLEDEDEKMVGEGNEKGEKKVWEAGIRRVSLLRRTKRGRREEATQLRNLSSVANNEYRRRTEYFEEDFDGDLRLLPLHPPIHPPSSKEETKISEGGEGLISGERKEKGRRGKRREHGTCSSSVPRDAFFYASHFLRFQKRKKKKKIARKTNDCCEERIRVFFNSRREEEEKERCTREGRGRREGGNWDDRRKILIEPRVGGVEEGQKWRASSPGGRGAVFARERALASSRILIENILDIRTRELHACVRSRKASFLTDNAFVFIVDRHL